jgi:hypothetical protein
VASTWQPRAFWGRTSSREGAHRDSGPGRARRRGGGRPRQEAATATGPRIARAHEEAASAANMCCGRLTGYPCPPDEMDRAGQALRYEARMQVQVRAGQDCERSGAEGGERHDEFDDAFFRPRSWRCSRSPSRSSPNQHGRPDGGPSALGPGRSRAPGGTIPTAPSPPARTSHRLRAGSSRAPSEGHSPRHRCSVEAHPIRTPTMRTRAQAVSHLAVAVPLRSRRPSPVRPSASSTRTTSLGITPGTRGRRRCWPRCSGGRRARSFRRRRSSRRWRRRWRSSTA